MELSDVAMEGQTSVWETGQTLMNRQTQMRRWMWDDLRAIPHFMM